MLQCMISRLERSNKLCIISWEDRDVGCKCRVVGKLTKL